MKLKIISIEPNRSPTTTTNGICPKVNVIARLEYELAYYDSAVHRFIYYTKKTPPSTTNELII